MKIAVSYFTVIQTTAFILGISPIKKYKTEKNHVIDVGHGLYEDTVPKYKRSYLGLAFWTIFFANIIYHQYDTYRRIEFYVNTLLDKCFHVNFCLTLVEIASTNLHPTTLVFFVAFYHNNQKLDCIARVQKFYDELPAQSRNPLLWFVIFQATAAISVFIEIDHFGLFECLIEYYQLAALITNDFMVMALCHIAAKSYEDINDKIESMIANRKIDQQQLIALEDKHWQVGNLSNDIDSFYGIQLLLFWPYYITRIISWLMFITNSQVREILSSSFAMQHYLQIILSVVIILYFSRNGTFLTNQAEKTNYLAQKLKFTCTENMNEINTKIIRIFILKLNSRKIKLTAGGFLQINMQLVQSFLGLILTYWIVLVQFRNDLKF